MIVLKLYLYIYNVFTFIVFLPLLVIYVAFHMSFWTLSRCVQACSSSALCLTCRWKRTAAYLPESSPEVYWTLTRRYMSHTSTQQRETVDYYNAAERRQSIQQHITLLRKGSLHVYTYRPPDLSGEGSFRSKPFFQKHPVHFFPPGFIPTAFFSNLYTTSGRNVQN